MTAAKAIAFWSGELSGNLVVNYNEMSGDASRMLLTRILHRVCCAATKANAFQSVGCLENLDVNYNIIPGDTSPKLLAGVPIVSAPVMQRRRRSRR